MGHNAFFRSKGCDMGEGRPETSLSVFGNLNMLRVEDDSIEGPIVLAPQTEDMIRQIEDHTLYASSVSGLEYAIAPILNEAATLDSLSASAVASAGSVALDSYEAWSNHYATGGSGGDSLGPYQPQQQSIFGGLFLQAGHYGKADVAGGLSTLAAVCLRRKIPKACASGWGLVGIFGGGAVGASLYEWLTQ